MTPLHLAVIGVGDVAERDYLPEWHRLDGQAEISVMCGRNPDRVRRTAHRYQVPEWSTDYLEVLHRDVDAVVNLTPIGLHSSITLAAIEAGRHVYSEKPLALSSRIAKTIRDAAASRNLVLVCAPSIMLFPQVVKVAEILSSGVLGAVKSARAQALAGVPPWPGYHSDPSPFFEAEAGPLVDMGVYPLTVLTGLFGPASAVTAMASKTRESFTVNEGPLEGQEVAVEAEDEWQLIVKMGDCIASIEANFATVGSAAPDCELRGDRGAVAFSLFDVAAPVLLLRNGGETWDEVRVQHERDSGPDHLLGILELVECVRSGRAPIPNADHAVHVLEVIEAARRAAGKGRTVAIPTTWDPASLAAHSAMP